MKNQEVFNKILKLIKEKNIKTPDGRYSYKYSTYPKYILTPDLFIVDSIAGSCGSMEVFYKNQSIANFGAPYGGSKLSNAIWENEKNHKDKMLNEFLSEGA